MISTPAITAIVIAILVALAFSGGFALSNWRDGNRIRVLTTDKAVLSAANSQCAIDIQSARTAFAALETATATRQRQADTAIKEAEPEAKAHTKEAARIQALPPVNPARQCDTIAQEQIIYVQRRHN